MQASGRLPDHGLTREKHFNDDSPDLDDRIRRVFATKNFTDEYWRYKASKANPVKPGEVSILHGCDGVSWQAFERDLDAIAASTCQKVANGEFFFSPLVEFPISKDPRLTLDAAIETGQIRTLSRSTIRDRIVQGLLYQVLLEYVEERFSQLGKISFAYRPLASAPEAARHVHDLLKHKGYTCVLDADIIKYFDRIPHPQLDLSLQNFFAEAGKHELLLRLLRRFYSSDRVTFDSYGKDANFFFNRKPVRTVRQLGIPQGGVISGMLANIYLHEFDSWISREIIPCMDAAYIRYADDFLLFFRDPQTAKDAFGMVRKRLASMKLEIHDLGQKSQIHVLDRTNQSIDFVGFSISSTAIRVQAKNIQKYQYRVLAALQEIEIRGLSPEEAARMLYGRVKYKVLGTIMMWPLICEKCHQPTRQFSWLHFFLSITDPLQLRKLDAWTRQAISVQIYRRLKKRIDLDLVKGPDYPTLEQTYYRLRKSLNKPVSYCNCTRYTTDVIQLAGTMHDRMDED